VEFGGGALTSSLGRHDAVLSWSVIADDPITARRLKEEWKGSGRVGVKSVFGGEIGQGAKRRADNVSVRNESRASSVIIVVIVVFKPNPFHDSLRSLQTSLILEGRGLIGWRRRGRYTR